MFNVNDDHPFYGCKCCGKVGTSAIDLRRQRCEGIHEPLFPRSSVDPIIEAVEAGDLEAAQKALESFKIDWEMWPEHLLRLQPELPPRQPYPAAS